MDEPGELGTPGIDHWASDASSEGLLDGADPNMDVDYMPNSGDEYMPSPPWDDEPMPNLDEDYVPNTSNANCWHPSINCCERLAA